MKDKDLYKEIFDFVMSHKHMENDIKKLGISCDGQETNFLDKDVISLFIKMYNNI